MTVVSLHAVRGFRMRRQHLIDRSPSGTMLEAIEAVHGIQAQISAHAHFAVAQRVEKTAAAEIEQALWVDKTLIKTWAMRSTVHWLPASEEPLFRSALPQLRVSWTGMVDRYWEREGLTKTQLEEMFAAVLEALEGGPLHRQEIAAIAVPKLGEWAAPYLTSSWGSGYNIMTQHGHLVFGPTRGTNVTFARRADWGGLPPINHADDRPPLELIRRYLHSFGPATVQDVAYWIGTTLRDVQPFWNRVLPELTPIEVNGDTRWILTCDLDELLAMERAKLPVRLVPAFDPLLLAHRDKSDILDMKFYKRIYGAAAWVYPSVLINGGIAGAWSYQKKSKELIITVEPFEKITKLAQKAIQRDANHLAKISGRTATVNFPD